MSNLACQSAKNVFSESRDSELVPSLAKSPAERSVAIEELRRRGPEAIPTILVGLGSNDNNIRLGCIELLGRVGNEKAFSALGNLAGDPSSDVRSEAVRWLLFSYRGDPYATEQVKRFSSADIGRAFQSSSFRIREMAVVALREKSPSSLQELKIAASASEPGIRALVVTGLAEYPILQVKGLIRAGIEDESDFVRVGTLRALEQRFREFKKNHGEAARKQLLGAVRDLLVGSLEYPNPEVKVEAAFALGASGDSSVLGPLRGAVRRGKGVVRRAALDAIYQIDTNVGDEELLHLERSRNVEDLDLANEVRNQRK